MQIMYLLHLDVLNENWMYENYKKINSLLIGVGGAFPLLLNTDKSTQSNKERWS